MKLSARERSKLRDLAASEAKDFATLTSVAGLDPAVDFRGADLRQVDFGTCDLAGYDFSDADLTGASFRKASVDGTIFTDALLDRVRWPRAKQTEVRLHPHQLNAFERMMADLDARNRALALMPVGTGMVRVLEEVIVAIHAKRGLRAGLVIVRSAAERDQLIGRLRGRLGKTQVGTIKDALSWGPALVVHNASQYDFSDGYFTAAVKQMAPFDALFATSLDHIKRLINSSGQAFSKSSIAAVDHSLIDGDRADRRLLLSRAQALFGEPSFVMEIDQALDAGFFRAVRIVAPFSLPPLFPIGKRDGHEKTLGALDELAEQLARTLVELIPAPMIAVCRDERQADIFSSSMIERLTGYHQWQVVRAGNRWTADRLLQAMGNDARILVTSLTRHAVEAVKLSDRAAILTPINMSTAQEIAFRPVNFVEARAPLVLDFANAFQGFRHVRHGLENVPDPILKRTSYD